jgi:hypothetical protein
LQPLELKKDPGSQTIGMALVRAGEDASGRKTLVALFFFHLFHRARLIRKRMGQRKNYRGRRRLG